MKFLYLILPFVSSALAEELVQCPCSQQDCSTAQDPCACANTNLVNEYFCCDGGTDAAKDLGLTDCQTGKRSIHEIDSWVSYGIPCDGPDDRGCPPDRPACIHLSGMSKGGTKSWGVCKDPRIIDEVARTGWPFETTTSTTADRPTVFVTSTITMSSSGSDSTSSVPVSTSTAVETTTVAPVPVSTSIAVEVVTVAPVPVSTSTAVEVVTVAPVPVFTSTAVEVVTVAPVPVFTSTTVVAPVPVSISTAVEIVTVPAPTFVSGTDTTTLITSTKTALQARDAAV